MKCKECHEIIPADVRYCPECGVLIEANKNKKNIGSISSAESYGKHIIPDAKSEPKPFLSPSLQNSSPSVRSFSPSDTPSASYRRSNNRSIGNKKPLILIGLIILLIAAVSSITSIIDNNFYTDNSAYEEIEITEDITTMEMIATEYVSEMIYGDITKSYDKLSRFDVSSFLYDTEMLTNGDIQTDSAEAVSEIYSNNQYINGILYNNVQKANSYIADYTLTEAPDFSLSDYYYIDEDTLNEWYFSYCNDFFNNEISVADYTGITENPCDMYEFAFEFTSSVRGAITHVYVVVADFEDGPYVIYDSHLIGSIIDSIVTY